MTAFLDRETLELIQQTAIESKETEVKSLPNNPEKTMVIASGELQVIDTPYVPKPRAHTVESLASFAGAFYRWGQAGDGLANIWVDLAAWRLLFFADEPLRRSSVTLRIRPSPQLLLLNTFAKPQALEQKSLVRMLRHDLLGCVEPSVLAAFRTVDFQKINQARQTIQHERQSLDADIVAQVIGEKKPEAFHVAAPLFAMKELEDVHCHVDLTLDIDCDSKRFILEALPGQLAKAIDVARAAVQNLLDNELAHVGLSDVVILDGSPD